MLKTNDNATTENRRQFFGRASTGIGVAALATLLNPEPSVMANSPGSHGLPGIPHFAPRAKRVIYLLQSGAPSQVDLFDYKPTLDKLHLTDLPDSIRQGKRLTGMTSRQKNFPVVKSPWKFQQHGQSGTWVSELLPHMAKVVDDICVIKSMHTEAINHACACTTISKIYPNPTSIRFATYYRGIPAATEATVAAGSKPDINTSI